jgi:xylulose-5-phosphate/fructose-6-phosphate phosphoketolase
MDVTLALSSQAKQISPASQELERLNAYWRAANYLSVGQIYLLANPLLREPLRREHIKPRLLGHWGTTPGLNFVYAHMNRAICRYGLNAIYVCGPGHGGPGIVANTWLEGTYSELYPDISQDSDGMRRLFRQFSFPGGIPTHTAPEIPGSIHEGAELGYSLLHAYGAVFDNPGLLACCVVGDGEAETGPCAASWHSNRFLDPARDGAVLPVLHLNGAKIAGPTLLARIPRSELEALFHGYGYKCWFVEGDDPIEMHHKMAAAMDGAVAGIRAIQRAARSCLLPPQYSWPMIVLRSPKGWTGPKMLDGERLEGTFRAHQVPLARVRESEEELKLLEEWMRSYRPEELFDTNGRLIPELRALAPHGERRMGASPNANGGLLLRELTLPAFRNYGVNVPAPGYSSAQATQVMGTYMRDVMKLNLDSRNFRVVSPDETASNRWSPLFEVTNRVWEEEFQPGDDHLARNGRVMEVLSEHMCQGWLEGYLLTGRHGFFSCDETFIQIVDSMFNQHATWLKECSEVSWRRPIASLNYLLSSHAWRLDPGFIDHAVNKKGGIVHVYLPPDANTLLSVTDHCLRSRNCINVIVAGKQPAPQWLTMEEAIRHCTAGVGIWDFASNDQGAEPDVVMACAGDVPTLETLAAVDWLRRRVGDLKIRVINVVDLMTLEPPSEHPNGLTDAAFDALFTKDKPIVFACHGYPWLIHRLAYRRANQRLHVRGYKEEGATTTPFDMCVLNEIDRFHLAIDVIERVPRLKSLAGQLVQSLRNILTDHWLYVHEHGEDMPEIVNWKWGTD